MARMERIVWLAGEKPGSGDGFEDKYSVKLTI